ncbi:MAG: CapA family protein [candidate division KSB1 bacterium]|nr:CapA family protein [candidate division KSB1 bacterium]
MKKPISNIKCFTGICIIMLLILSPILYVKAVSQTIEDKSNLSILLFGDTNIQNRNNPVDAFQHVLPVFRKADFRLCNLEGPFAGTSDDPLLPDIPHKHNWTHSEPDMVQGLVDAGIDAVSVANNVTYPWTALMKSLKVLQEHGIRHTGGGANLNEAHRPVILEKHGVKVGLLAYACTVFPFQHAADETTPGIASMRIHTYYEPPHKYDKPGTPPVVVTVPYENELRRMKQDIRELKAETNIVIVSYHWGRSHHTELIDYQIEVASAAVDAGADVIMGHGNHEVAAVEVYKDASIFYGLGNFVFDWPQISDRPYGLLANIHTAAGRIDRVTVLPVKRDNDNNPRILDPGHGDGADLYRVLKERTAERASLRVEENEIVIHPASAQ